MIDKVVLLTGASQGIGLSTAEELGKAGYKVYATCRQPKKAKTLQNLVKNIPNITILKLDVTLKYQVIEVVEYVFKKEKRIDILINNAGFGIYGPSEIHTIKEMKKIFNTNVISVLRMNQAVIPIMRKQLSGRIINIGSISGLFPSKNMALYSASKAALEFVSASDACHLARWNIKVILILPGPVVTNFEQSIALGTHFKKKDEDNPYAAILDENKAAWKKIMENGQPAFVVAHMIKQAIESPNPNFWNPTSQNVQNEIEKHFKEPTGNSRVPQMKMPFPNPLRAKL
jgi:short-subunit dehydrogenase